MKPYYSLQILSIGFFIGNRIDYPNDIAVTILFAITCLGIAGYNLYVEICTNKNQPPKQREKKWNKIIH